MARYRLDIAAAFSEAADEPAYVISVASRLVGVHAQTLRTYERLGLLEPARSPGNIRLYSAADVQRAQWIRSLIEDLGINLAGVEVIIRMSQRIRRLEQEVRRLEAQRSGGEGRRGIEARFPLSRE